MIEIAQLILVMSINLIATPIVKKMPGRVQIPFQSVKIGPPALVTQPLSPLGQEIGVRDLKNVNLGKPITLSE